MKFKCRVCNGTGMVENAYFEICRTWEEVGELDMYALSRSGDCKNCPTYYREKCGEGEFVPCSNCDGMGEMTVDLNLWEVVE